MKIVIPGGSGQVGRMLVRALGAAGHEVVVLTRASGARVGGPGVSRTLSCSYEARVVQWDGRTLGEWAGEIDGADVVINLAGRSVNCRYTAARRREILDSRVESTRVIGEAIARAGRPPRVWLQASTATIYAHRYDAANDDVTGIIGGHEAGAPDTWNFSIDVATAWERAAEEAVMPGTRKVLMRSAMTMSPDRGGVFDVLLGLVRWGLGGKAGDGRQYVSWIHERDFVRAVLFLIEREDLAGAVNLAAPGPVPNAEFMRVLREAWGTRVGLPAARWMLEVGTFLMRSESELVLKSRRVAPRRLVEAGFGFEFGGWGEAARELVGRWREGRARTDAGAGSHTP